MEKERDEEYLRLRKVEVDALNEYVRKSKELNDFEERMLHQRNTIEILDEQKSLQAAVQILDDKRQAAQKAYDDYCISKGYKKGYKTSNQPRLN